MEQAGRLVASVRRNPSAPDGTALPDVDVLDEATTTMLAAHDSALGRLRRRTEVPAGDEPRPPAASPPPHRLRRRARRRGRLARRDGGRRHPRPPRWRLLALLGRRALAGPALREDALRQRVARPHLPARLAGHRGAPVPRRGRLDDRVRAVGPVAPRRRPLPRRGRRLAAAPADADHAEEGAFYVWTPAQVAEVLRRGRSGRARRRGVRVVRHHRARQLRGRVDPEPAPRPGAARTDRRGSRRHAARCCAATARPPAPRAGRQGPDRVERADAGHPGPGRRGDRSVGLVATRPGRPPRSCATGCAATTRSARAGDAGCAPGRPTPTAGGARAAHLAYAADHGALDRRLPVPLRGHRRAALAGRGGRDRRGPARAVLGHGRRRLEHRRRRRGAGGTTQGPDGQRHAVGQLAWRRWDCCGSRRTPASTRFGEHARTILRTLGGVAGRHALAFGNLLWAIELHVVGRHRGGRHRRPTRPGRPRCSAASCPPRCSPGASRATGRCGTAANESGADGRAYVCRDHTCEAPVGTTEELAASSADAAQPLS